MQAKKWPIILPTMLVLIVLLGQSLSAYGQTKLPGTNRAESESNDKGSATARSETEPAEEKQTEPQTKIDETGKQVGQKIVNSGLENIGKRPHIRWLTNLTITYDTPPDKVERAVSILEEILGDHEGMNPEFPPRVYFNGFNDWSLNIMLIAWYHPADYWAMQAWQQQTCLQILKRFNVAGIEFAFPSRTLYMANDDNRQLKLELLRGETATYVPRENSHE